MIFLILWIVCSAAIWYVYHSVFQVIYFGDGFLKEIVKIAAFGLVASYFMIAGFAKSPFITILVIVAIIGIIYFIAKNK